MRTMSHYHLKHALDQRARRNEGPHECPEADHLDAIVFAPHVSWLLLLAAVAFVVVVVVLALGATDTVFIGP